MGVRWVYRELLEEWVKEHPRGTEIPFDDPERLPEAVLDIFQDPVPAVELSEEELMRKKYEIRQLFREALQNTVDWEHTPPDQIQWEKVPGQKLLRPALGNPYPIAATPHAVPAGLNLHGTRPFQHPSQ